MRIERSKIALFEIGFRPFFLLGTLTGVFSLLTWLLVHQGSVSNVFVDSMWHAHEMVFGFVIGIVVGFLLTASQNWSGKRGVHGFKLVILVMLWLSARILAYTPNSVIVMAFVDLAFLPLTVIFLCPYLMSVPQKRNRGFPVLLALLWLCNLAFHMSAVIDEDFRRRSLLLAIQIVVVIVVIIAGRIVPLFSKNAVPEYLGRSSKRLDMVALLCSLLFLVAYAHSEFGFFTFICGNLAAFGHLVRFWLWFDRKVVRKPILAVLYVGYLWVVLAYFLAGLAAINKVLPTVATHSFTVGAISLMIVGMMTRVTRGHTGRNIVATKLTGFTYLLMTFAALVRVFLPIVTPSYYLLAVHISGACWLASAICYLAEYSPMLLWARIDGNAG